MACTMFAAIDVGSYEVNLKIYELSARKGIHVVNHVRHRMELGKDRGGNEWPPSMPAADAARSWIWTHFKNF